MEELFFCKNVTTAINVAHARGVLLLTAVKECGRMYEYTPLQIKQALTGYGRADKNQIQQMVKTFLRLSKSPSRTTRRTRSRWRSRTRRPTKWAAYSVCR